MTLWLDNEGTTPETTATTARVPRPAQPATTAPTARVLKRKKTMKNINSELLRLLGDICVRWDEPLIGKGTSPWTLDIRVVQNKNQGDDVQPTRRDKTKEEHLYRHDTDKEVLHRLLRTCFEDIPLQDRPVWRCTTEYWSPERTTTITVKLFHADRSELFHRLEIAKYVAKQEGAPLPSYAPLTKFVSNYILGFLGAQKTLFEVSKFIEQYPLRIVNIGSLITSSVNIPEMYLFG